MFNLVPEVLFLKCNCICAKHRYSALCVVQWSGCISASNDQLSTDKQIHVLN